MKALHLTFWNAPMPTGYENADTKKCAHMSWYPKKTKLVGEGIGHVLDQENGPHLLGMWNLIEIIAATSVKEQRGWLVRNGSPLNATRMGKLARISAEHFEKAITFFLSPEMGWLEWAEMPDSFQTHLPLTSETPTIGGKSSGNPPDSIPLTSETPTIGGKNSATDRETEREVREREERGTPPHSPADAGVPSLPDVEAWAVERAVPVPFARMKYAEHSERSGWKVRGKLIDWRERFGRYWEQDGPKWLKSQKNAARPGGAFERPDAWKEGDQDWWWTDAVSSVKAALSGAALQGDEKMAARLREVLAARRGAK